MTLPIAYEDYIWGDKFRTYLDEHKGEGGEYTLGIRYSNIDDVLLLSNTTDRIVTHNGDTAITQRHVDAFPNLKRWCGTNVCVEDSRVVPIPIGLENDYIGGQPERKRILHQKSQCFVIKWDVPRNLCYYNCGMSHPERLVARNYFSRCEWSDLEEAKPNTPQGYGDYCDSLLNHHFVISPRGNGLDCHRTWEALYLGCYVVMKRLHSLENLYDGLPVLFVDDWSQVTQNLLQVMLPLFQHRKWNYKKLTFGYWKELIQNNYF